MSLKLLILQLLVFNLVLTSCLVKPKDEGEDEVAAPGNITLVSAVSASAPILRVTGSFTTGQIVNIYAQPNCQSYLGSGTATAGGEAEIQISLQYDGVYNFSANVSGPKGNKSACTGNSAFYSFSGGIVLNPSIAVASSNPSPGNRVRPTFLISNLQPGSSGQIFFDSNCDIPASTSVTEDGSGNALVTLNSNITNEGVHTFFAGQTIGTFSACGSSGTNYELDLNNINLSISPNPGADSTPDVTVSNLSPSFGTVALYSDSDCLFPISNAVSVGATGTETVNINVPQSVGFNNIYAKQTISGTSSSCTLAPYSYEVSPFVSAVSINGPTTDSDLTPSLRVDGGVIGATINVYSGFPCTSGNLIDSGSTVSSDPEYFSLSSNLQIPGGSYTGPVTYTFYVEQVVGGVPQGCDSGINTTYTLDLSGASISILATPSGFDNTPDIVAGDLTTGGLVNRTYFYESADCSGVSFADQDSVASTSLTQTVNPIAAPVTNKPYSYRQVIDGVNQTCYSATYTLSAAPTLVTYVQTSDSDQTPDVTLSNLNTTATTVNVYYDQTDCSGTADTTFSPSSATETFTTLGYTPTTDGNYSISYEQTYAGFTSDCTSTTFTLDSRPTLTVTNDSDVFSLNPELSITNMDTGSTLLSIYEGSACDTLIGTVATPGASTTYTIPTPLSSPATYTYTVKYTYGTHDGENCSAPATFTFDNTVTRPTSLATSSLSTDVTPTITVANTQAGNTINLYTDSTCSTFVGSTVATGTTASVDVSGPGLTAEGAYSFYAEQIFSGYTSPCSTDSASFTLNVTPTGISDTAAPPTDTNNGITPYFDVAGAISGGTINIYSGASCNTLIGSATYSGDPTPVQVNIATPLTGSSTYTISANQVVGSVTSACSSSTHTYSLSSTITDINVEGGDGNSGTAHTASVTVTGSFDDGSIIYVYSSTTQLTPSVPANCGGNLIGSAVASGGSATISPTLAIANGLNYFYAKEEVAGYTHDCSSQESTYTLSADPLITLNNPTTDTWYRKPNYDITNLIVGATFQMYPTQTDCENDTNGQDTTPPTATGTGDAIFPDDANQLTAADEGNTITYWFKQYTTSPAWESNCVSDNSYTFNSAPTVSMSSSSPDITPDVSVDNVYLATDSGGANIAFYSDSNCTGGNELMTTSPQLITALGEVETLDNFPNIIPTDGSHTIYATQTFDDTSDGTGNGSYTSPCSAVTTYFNLNTDPVLDGVAQTTYDQPTWTLSSLDDSGGWEVYLYKNDPTCLVSALTPVGGAAVTSTPQGFQLPAGQITAEESVNYYAKAIHVASGFFSDCVDLGAYDSTLPDMSVVAPTPNPGQDTQPDFTFTAIAAGSTMELFLSADCSGVADTTISAGEATMAPTTAITADGTTTYSLQYTLDNISHCYDNGGTGYVYDFDTESLTLALDGTMTGHEIRPVIEVSGIIDTGANDTTVTLYSNDDCSTAISAATVYGGTDPLSIQLNTDLTVDGLNEIYVQQTIDPGGTLIPSPCSGAYTTPVKLDYTVDNAPDSITLDTAATDLQPERPTFTIGGTYEGGTLSMYSGSCGGTLVGSTLIPAGGGISDITSASVQVSDPSSLTAEGNTDYYFRTTTQNSVVTSCEGPYTYTLDLRPTGVTITTTSPGTTATPSVQVTGLVDDGTSTAMIYSDSACTSGNELWSTPGTESGTGSTAAIPIDNGAFSITDATYPNFQVYARQTYDGIVSACSDVSNSNTYQYDRGPSSVSSLTVSPGGEPQPVVKVSGVSFGDQIKVYDDAACSNLITTSTAAGTNHEITIFPGLATDATKEYYIVRSELDSGSYYDSICTGDRTTPTANTDYAYYDFMSVKTHWTKKQTVVDTNAANGDLFGGAGISISGNTMAVGYPSHNSSQGRVAIFSFNGATWSQVDSILGGATGDEFGTAVALNGNYLAVTAKEANTGVGTVYLYRYDSGTWDNLQDSLNHGGADADEFGASLALSVDELFVGAPGANQVFWYNTILSNTITDPGTHTFTGSGGYGTSIDYDGTNLIVGAPSSGGSTQGQVFIYATPTANNTAAQTLTGGTTGDLFGSSVAIMGSSAAVGAPGANTGDGAAYAYNGTTWATQNVLDPTSEISPDSNFGRLVRMSSNEIIVSGQSATDFFAVSFTGTNFAEPTVIQAIEVQEDPSNFGKAFDVTNTFLVIGAELEDIDQNASIEGAAVIFKK